MKTCGLITAALIGAGIGAPAAAQDRPLPPGTNPAQRMVYPAEGQDVDTQQRDQLECYWWANDQTGGWDPYEAYRVLQEKGYVAADQAEAAAGGGIRGAAGGALAGVAIGAIAGDAGTGAAIGAVAGGLVGGSRSRRAQAQAQAQMEAAIDEFNQNFQRWDRAWVGCMQARDYTVT
jgi:hypothetical protein